MSTVQTNNSGQAIKTETENSNVRVARKGVQMRQILLSGNSARADEQIPLTVV